MGKLDPWIPREGGDCDIVVVNMQESTYTVPNAVYNETVAEAQRLMMNLDTEREDFGESLSVAQQVMKHGSWNNDEEFEEQNESREVSDVVTQLLRHASQEHADQGARETALKNAVMASSIALGQNPQDVTALQGRADALHEIGRLDQAKTDLDKILALEESSASAKERAVAYTSMGRIFEEQKNTAEARHCFDEALKLDPENTEILGLIRTLGASLSTTSLDAVDVEEEAGGEEEEQEEKANRADETVTDVSAPETALEQLASSLGLEKGRKHLVLAIAKQLNTECFYLVKNVRRAQMRLRVYARKELKHRIHTVAGDAENTGAVGGWAPNKGGQVIKLVVDQTSLCFVGSHLTAHEGAAKCQQRNTNVKSILEGVRFGNKSIDIASQYHFAFWFGDMNYRTKYESKDGGPDVSRAHTFESIKELVSRKDWTTLRKYDELEQEIAARRVLCDWKALPCNFAPTFKVVRDEPTEVYDERRLPAYTDRVLYKPMPGLRDQISVREFTSASDFVSSDHKPVRALFDIRAAPALAAAWDIRNGNLPFSIKFKTIEATVPVMDSFLEGGKADPYILFYTDPQSLIAPELDPNSSEPESTGRGRGRTSTIGSTNSREQIPHVKSEILHKTLQPKWDDLTIHMKIEDSLEEICGAHLIMLFMDHDWGASHDPIGTVLLSLEDLVDQQKTHGHFKFSCAITQNGLPRGEVHGTGYIESPLISSVGADGKELKRASSWFFRNPLVVVEEEGEDSTPRACCVCT